MHNEDWPVHTGPKEKSWAIKQIMRRSKIHVIIDPEDGLDVRRRIKWPII